MLLQLRRIKKPEIKAKEQKKKKKKKKRNIVHENTCYWYTFFFNARKQNIGSVSDVSKLQLFRQCGFYIVSLSSSVALVRRYRC